MKTSRTVVIPSTTRPGTIPQRGSAGPGPASRSGALLIECLVYLAVVMIVVGLLLGAFLRAYTHARRLQQVSAQIVQSLRAGERWRGDVRTATGSIRQDEKDGAAGLLLLQPGGAVAYRFRDQTIWRQSGTNQTWQPLLRNVKSSRFEPVARSRVQAWRWELELNVTNRPARMHPLFTFQAVPGFVMTP